MDLLLHAAHWDNSTMHVARKRFGQHFLHDKHIIQRLVTVIAPQPDQHIVEIGPGQGALTVPILKEIGQLDVVEIDWDLIPALKTRCLGKGALIVHQADALEFDFTTLQHETEPLRIIGNLPYNISTPLIFHLLTFAERITDMHFMLQKEVVDRLAAKSGDDAYGRLSIMVQYHCEVTSLFHVPPGAFYPPPQVESAVVRLVPHSIKPHIAHDYKHFSDLVKEAFSHRRKTLRNSMKKMLGDSDWEKSKIDPHLRPEELGVADYVYLSNLTKV
jgi:16S rRNA (adenine1518-N6/adenine1519-N6)-dimethyltransferase